ncbi:MAG: nucleolar RNA-binding Nop10p family protein [Nanoarchaeota archaeon]|mgnify:CR=1 FL=1
MKHIMKCTLCNNYTMNSVCKCGAKALSPKPMKYSPLDKFASYRRKVMHEDYEKRGLA